jgi:membrane-associated phospholipid phosphatase
VGSYTFFAIGAEVGDCCPTRLDERAFDVAEKVRSDVIVDLAKAFSFLGTAGFLFWLVVAASITLLAMRRPLEAAAISSGAILTYVAVHVAKGVVDRPRPLGGLVDASGSAYPSGHAAYAVAWVAIAVAFWHAIPALTGKAFVVVIGLVVAAAIGLSRVELRVHYYSDVLGGWGLGAACFALCGVVALVIDTLRHTDAP